MNSDPIPWIRPAPEYEQAQITIAPVVTREAPPDLEAMANDLDQMKIEAERLRPGLNGFFTLLVLTGVSYMALYVAQERGVTITA